ncbi:transcription factor ETV7 isoform X1 [Syngnathus scovelli]|uniref:transcription factor ETV7 isoform X1 n=1 Tax=Syngnathus scovelli TaxID=161590 RepID=UPI00210F4598|nr:transcription factor ETV7 isoform X1 [Syngnathus scovelli]
MSMLVKGERQKRRAPTLMLETQISGHHLPPDKIPKVSTPSQDDLWHLPGQLRINPSLWDRNDVSLWLHWAHKEYSLRRPEKAHFEMNGRALCLLTKEDFRHRCPSSGDVLYEILQCVIKHRRNVVYQPPKRSHIQSTDRPQMQVPKIEESPSPSLDNTRAPQKQDEPETLKEEPLDLTCQEKPQQQTHTPDGRLPARVLYQRPGSLRVLRSIFAVPSTALFWTEMSDVFPGICFSHSSSLGVTAPSAPMTTECRFLSDYVYNLLCDDQYQEYIRWENRGSLVFRVVDPNGLARLWGHHKNRDNMTYEKMSRALRHYYKLNIIKKEHGQKLLFRFLKTPQDISKQLDDTLESPAHSPLQDSNVSDSSPLSERNEEHFEVSPYRTSPECSPSAPPLR